jgi:hypothetical protein
LPLGKGLPGEGRAGGAETGEAVLAAMLLA